MAAAGCGSPEAEPRAQLVVVVDTDLPLASQVQADPELSAAVAIDTVLVEVLDGAGAVTASLSSLGPDTRDWPVSFGITAEGGATDVRLRLRAFAAQSPVAPGTGVPRAGFVVDRVADLTLPASGVRTVRVVLRGACLAVPPSFGGQATTCIDEGLPSAPPSQGVEELASRQVPSLAGTWARARDVACSGPAQADRPCVPGGIGVLGDERLAGQADGFVLPVDPTPSRLVRLSPFRMDRTEMTVGRFRALLLAQPGVLQGVELPILHDDAHPDFQWCTWRGVSTADHDAEALSCVPRATAVRACEALGGRLPTDAEWERAARGRGQGRMYPWGDATPPCCGVSFGRGYAPSDGGSECLAAAKPGPSLPGAFAGAACPVTDVSRDGIVDLAGNLGEVTLGRIAAYDAPCWPAVPVPLDPRCDELPNAPLSTRGATWQKARARLPVALRFTSLSSAPLVDTGFRCVYPEAP